MELPIEVVLLAAAAILFIFLILLIIMWVKLNRVKKTYTALLNGQTGMNIEEVVIGLQDRYNALKVQTDQADQSIQNIRQDMIRMKSRLGVYRFNAFSESGSDLSFAIALVDEEATGVVLSAIHNRDQAYVYAKPLVKGQSKYALSPEEKEAINRSSLKE
ncbi:DUF4446 family protein [Paenibacillus puerhi]|uniref:DUF4446 family protein n=1 Tax=Paenibacillus puerhi TaxID=2692622 RepID=UPI00135BE287|nr:DUF4446 family protein [Paenibacillus puerhi]